MRYRLLFNGARRRAHDILTGEFSTPADAIEALRLVSQCADTYSEDTKQIALEEESADGWQLVTEIWL